VEILLILQNFYQHGQSEEKIAWALEKSGINRDEFVIATKFSLPTDGKDPNLRGNNKKSLVTAVDASLKRLNTKYIDLLYVHYWDFTMETDVLMRALDDVVRSGKVLHIGISDAPAWEVSSANTLAKIQGWSQFCAYQGRYSLSTREVENDIIPMCEKHKLGFIPWGVLGGGKLTGKLKKNEESKDVVRVNTMSEIDYKILDEVSKIAEELNVSCSQVACNWMINKPQIASCLIGPRNYEQFSDNMKSLDFQLTKEQMNKLDSISSQTTNLIFPYSMIGQSYKTGRLLYLGQEYIIE